MKNAETKNTRENPNLGELVEQKRSNVVAEFWGLLRHNKKWWLAPIIIVSLLVGALLVLFGTPVAPLIYTLF
jgi:hypothetical protein